MRQTTRQCGRPSSRNGPREGDSSSRNARQQGDRTRFLQTDMELLSVLKGAPQGAAQRPTRKLKHCTLGIRLREVAGYLPLTALGVKAGAATIQQTRWSLSDYLATLRECTLRCRKAKGADHTRCTRSQYQDERLLLAPRSAASRRPKPLGATPQSTTCTNIPKCAILQRQHSEKKNEVCNSAETTRNRSRHTTHIRCQQAGKSTVWDLHHPFDDPFKNRATQLDVFSTLAESRTFTTVFTSIILLETTTTRNL